MIKDKNLPILETEGSPPPENHQQFIQEATALFLKKSTDYDHRFLRGLIEHHGRTIWAWEVDKKLDRLRTWIKRGKLQVNGEGLRNSVDDLFIYSVQYISFVNAVINDGMEPEAFLKEWNETPGVLFESRARRLKPTEFTEWLKTTDRIGSKEIMLQNIIRLYMGDNLTGKDWRAAIQEILGGKK